MPSRGLRCTWMQRGMNKTRIRARLVNALPGTGVMDWVQEEQSPKNMPP